MKNMVLFADANVILETLLPERPKALQAEQSLAGRTVYISMLTVHLAYHFGKKEGYSLQEIKTALAGYHVLDLTREDYQSAGRLVKNNDFEDALQLAVALRSNCDTIVTLDKPFAHTYEASVAFIIPR
jgi:predicted nucleic acid-binding protein